MEGDGHRSLTRYPVPNRRKEEGYLLPKWLSFDQRFNLHFANWSSVDALRRDKRVSNMATCYL